MAQKELDIIIHPHKGAKERSLPSQAIVVPNPTEARIAEEVMRQQQAEPRYLYNSRLYVDQGQQLCVAGPSLGAPAAALVVEKLIALGVSSICLFSCCGTINQEICIGDALVGVFGISGEGVSQYYGNRKTVFPCPRATDRLRTFLSEDSIAWHEGGIWSTDAPYRERRSQLNSLRSDHGIAGVDMEFTALCSIAHFRKVSLSALFVVSDELWGETWNPGFTRNTYTKRSRFLLERLIHHCREDR